MKKLDDKQRAKYVDEVTRLGTIGGTVAALKIKGNKVSDEQRDEMLAALHEGKYVELEMSVLAFEQFETEANRNHIRFTPAALKQLATTAKLKPFIRDHAQNEALARAGSIVSAKLEKGETSTILYEDVSITATWAVELALRNLISSVSIGWYPTGPVLCSSCKTPVFSRCWHFPGDRLAEEVDAYGGKRKVRKADGNEIVEWVYTSVALVETSIVTVPAVPSARIEEIRAAMSAVLGAPEAQKEDQMIDLERLAKVLGAAAPTEEAIEARARALGTVATELAIAKGDIKDKDEKLATATAELAILRKEQGSAKRDEFLRAGVAEGRITPGDKELWGVLWDASSATAQEQMAKRSPQSATPVGAKRQSAAVEAPSAKPGAGGTLDAELSAELEERGASEEATLSALEQLGVKEPKKALATHGRAALGIGEA